MQSKNQIESPVVIFINCFIVANYIKDIIMAPKFNMNKNPVYQVDFSAVSSGKKFALSKRRVRYIHTHIFFYRHGIIIIFLLKQPFCIGGYLATPASMHLHLV